MFPATPVPVLFRHPHVPDSRRAVGVPRRTGKNATPEQVTLQIGEVPLHVLLITGFPGQNRFRGRHDPIVDYLLDCQINPFPTPVPGRVHIEIEDDMIFQRLTAVRSVIRQ